MKVAFLGLGTMGLPHARHLAKEHDVCVWNRTPKAFPQGTVLGTPAEAAQTDVICTCVSDDAALRDVLFGRQGVFSGDLKGKTLIDSSTVSVALAGEIAKRAEDAGAAFLDAPITGSKLGAERGTTMFMVGGPKAVYERCLPLFNAMGAKIVYCGPSTFGQRAKLALNLTQALMLESYLEGCALALKNGVPLDVIQEILDNSGARSGVSSFKLPYIRQRDFAQHFKTWLMHKDVSLAKQEWEKLGLDLPLAKNIVGVLERAAKEWPDEDFSSIARTLEKQGVRFE